MPGVSVARSRIVSADSHVVEPPSLYAEYLDPIWRPDAPRLVPDGSGGQQIFIPGMTRVLALGLLASAGQPSHLLNEVGTTFQDIRCAAWDPRERLKDQDADGVAAEVLYPSVGLALLTHINRQYAGACFRAYNRWLADFCAADRARLIGCGVSAAPSPRETCSDLAHIHELGLRGAVLPLEPGTAPYYSREFDQVWKTAVDLNLPISFHAQPPRLRQDTNRSSLIIMGSVWEAQDLLLSLIAGGVFARHPQLRIVLAEFDVEWLPHLINRLDHQTSRHSHWLKLGEKLEHPPSHYVGQSVFLTASDELAHDWPTRRKAARVMWSSDFPHSDSTFPFSREAAHRLGLCFPEYERDAVLGETVLSLYDLDLHSACVNVFSTDGKRVTLRLPWCRQRQVNWRGLRDLAEGLAHPYAALPPT
jgi:predicted TIM-barrel fold metal-dependent hydrolase